MKYYKQWTLTETLISVLGNLRKKYQDNFYLRSDYNQILMWTREDNPVLKVIFYIEATQVAAQAAFDELLPNDGVRRFRIAGSDMNITEKVEKALGAI